MAGQSNVLDFALSGTITVLPFVILALVYLLVLHTPQSPQFTPLAEKLTPGDRIITKSGIIGCIVKISAKTCILEVYDGSLIEMSLNAVSEKLP